MSIDPELVRKLSNRQKREEQTVKALVYSVHRTSPWRELISLESVVLPPVPVIKNKSWTLHALLALPQHEQLNVTAYFQPWGIVSWSWPERVITQVVDLRLQGSEDIATEQSPIPNIPAAEAILLNLEVQARREQALFRALDELLATPPTNEVDLYPLAGLYSGLLPKELYACYWKIFPATREWLKPDASLQEPVPEGGEPKKRLIVTFPQKGELSYEEQTTTDEAQDALPAYQQALSRKEETLRKAAPRDLSPQIGGWWQRTANLAEACQAQEITMRLQTLEARLRYPGFRLAVVGEFNRGKSTLINLLLERTLVPVGVVPTTAAVTSIIYDEHESMHIQFPDGRSEQRSLVAVSWSDLVVTEQDKNKQLVAFPQVRITLPQPWLHELDAEIIDTPGVNDPYGPRSALVSDVLSNADAAVLLIAAHSPLSLTETVFLEQEVLGRHVPHVIVVVSMLDRIEPEQRAMVMDNVREKIASISPQIPVVATQALDSVQTAEQALAEIRSQIQVLATHSERRAWRSQQLVGQLADYAQQIADLGQVALDAACLDADKRAEELRTMQDNALRGALEWELIGIELKKRAIYREQELQRRLDTAKERILDTVLFDLSKTRDPKIWWEQDFPFRLRQHFLGVVREVEPFVLGALGQDTQWLQARVQKAFHITLSYASPQIEGSHDIVTHQEQMEIADIQRIRLFSRIGSGAATVVSYLLLGPIGIAISIAGGIISDQTLGKRIKEQQQQIEVETCVCIERSIQGYFEQVSQRLEELYDRMLDELRQQQTTWEASKTRILQNSTSTNQEQDWQRVIEEAVALNKEICSSLAQP